MKQVLLLLVLIYLSPVAYARMYQWVDPDTGTTQLSGKPPTWYRSDESGPRIIVFENGRIIDDTGISVPVEQREQLRQQALISVEQDRQAALVKLQQAEQQKAALELQQRGNEPQEILPDIPIARPEPEQTPAASGPTAEELRALIEQYESMKTQNARELIETAVPPASGPAPAILPTQ